MSDRAAEILESISDGFYAVDRNWCFTYINRRAEELWKLPREALLGANIWEVFPQAVGGEAQAAHFRAARERVPVRFELDSRVLQTWVSGTIYPTSDGVSVYFQDISQRHRMEMALRESEQRYRALANVAREAIVIHDNGHILDVNESFLAQFGYGYEEARDLGSLGFIKPECRPGMMEQIRRGGDRIYETVGQRKDGTTIPLEVHARPFTYQGKAARVCVLWDLTERRAAQAERRRAEHLAAAIREAHHRIGNHLQSVTDLLSLALAELEPGRATEVLQATVLRVQSMGQVHALLKRETDFDQVDSGELFRRVVPWAVSCHNRATIDLDVQAESLPLAANDATTLTLVVQELVSNAVRHGLAGRRGGHLRVHFTADENQARLVVADNGVGLPPGFDLDTHAGMGLQLVRALAEHRFEGRLTLRSEHGVQADVRFDIGRLRHERSAGADL